MERYKEVSFGRLRSAYITVNDFVFQETRKQSLSLETRIEEDITIAGDDVLELLEKFVETFNLRFDTFNYNEHFYSEGELFGSPAVLKLMFGSILYLALLVFLPFTKTQLDHFIHRFWKKFSSPQVAKKDLSMRELIIWYLEGQYIAPSQIHYRIKLIG